MTPLPQIRPLETTKKQGLPLSILEPPVLPPLEVAWTIEEEWENTSEDGKVVSEAVYWEQYYEHPDVSYEWNNGILEVKPMSDYLNYSVYDWFGRLLGQFLQVHPIARTIGLETGFRLAMSKKTTIRKPDLGIVLNSNPTPLKDKDRSYHGVFDMCIESLSDSSKKERDRDLVIKKGEYAAIGVREYYILADNPKYTAFYRLNNQGIYEPIDSVAGVIYSKVLVGLQFRRSDLWRKPGLIELAKDDVYQGYVLPEYQAERQRAEQERLRADKEQYEKEQERQRAERYAAKLTALGISLE